MKKQFLDIERITQYYRILGLPMTATLQEIRHSRNKLLMRFHPDRQADNKETAQPVHLVQEAYLFLTEHHQQIVKEFDYLNKSTLSSQNPTKLKSHWVYSEIANIKK